MGIVTPVQYAMPHYFKLSNTLEKSVSKEETVASVASP